MSTLSQPMRALLESALAAPTGTIADDVERLRETLTVVLRRCLELPGATWPELIGDAARRGGWDHWRGSGLQAAAASVADAAPEVTRHLLVELGEELRVRGDVIAEAWEGEGRQVAVESPQWVEGRQRRDLIFAIESAMAHAKVADADALAASGANIAARDLHGSFPGLADALQYCAADLALHGALSMPARDRLVVALDGTPFAAAAADLPVAPLSRSSAEKVIRLLQLEPLPVEGGLFRQTWRREVDGYVIGTATFAAFTDDGDSFSAMHRLASDEIWHFYLGDPVQMVLLHLDGQISMPVLGQDLVIGQSPQLVVLAGTWMGAYLVPGGKYAVFGNTMAPGFQSSSYEGGVREYLQAGWPAAAALIERLTRPDAPTTMPEQL